MLDIKCCKTEADIDVFFEGMKAGAGMMLGFERKKNVNTGKPLKFEEMISDIETIKESAKLLINKNKEAEP